MSDQCWITVQDTAVWPIIVFMNIGSDRSTVTIPIRPKDIILFHGIGKGDYRAFGTAPVIVPGINILNIVTIGIYVD